MLQCLSFYKNFMENQKEKKNILIIYLIFFFSMLFSIIILNRWFVTDLGFGSYGRLWQFYVSYIDFGFIRRGLLGTLFFESGINSMFSNEYMFAFFIHHISIFILTALIVYYFLSKKIKNFIFIFGIAFSPTLITYQGYNTGNLDLIILIIALINILYVKSYIIFSLNIALGIFIHELFIFMLPAQFFAFYLFNKSKTFNKLELKNIFPFIIAISAVLIILFFGNTNVSMMDFKNIMQNKISNAYMIHPLWSGFDEINPSSIGINLEAKMLKIIKIFENGKVLFLLPSLVYLIILILRATKYISSNFNRFLFIVAILFPILASFVASDYPRWIAMSANMSLLITLKFVARDDTPLSKWNKLIAIFCLLAPFGTVAVDIPFPLHQFFIDKFIY